MSEEIASPSIAVVILNFNDIESTIACCEEHLRLIPPPANLILVDNGSSNNSYHILNEKYSGHPLIHIMKSDKNLGFSGGFNIGIRAARQMGYDSVICANSDTVPISTNIITRFCNSLRDHRDVGVVAPQITETAGDRNPEFETLSIRYLVQLTSARNPRYARYARAIIRSIVPYFTPITSRQKPNQLSNPSVTTTADKIIGPVRYVFKVHGSYFMLTSSFLDVYDGLDDDIFLQGEEHLITWMNFTAKLHILLLEDCNVFHAGGASKNTIGNYKEDVDDLTFTWKIRTAQVLRTKISISAYFFCLIAQILRLKWTR